MLYKWSLISWMIIALGLLGQAANASAAGRPCLADIEKFCADVSFGGGRVAECLRQHYTELSAECRARGQELHEHVQEAHEACRDDISKFCGEVRPGEGHIVTCLRSHDKDLSADCRAALKPAH
jgi:hypothetical protein